MKRRSDRLRDRGRVGSVTTVGFSHRRQDAAGGTRAPRRRGQVDDDRFALDSTLLVIVADGEARDAVVILAAGDDARLRDHGAAVPRSFETQLLKNGSPPTHGSDVACTRSSLTKSASQSSKRGGKAPRGRFGL